MAYWISAQGQLQWFKNSKTFLSCDVTKKTPPTQFKWFFKIETKRLAESVDGLSSSVAIVAGEL